MTTPIRTANSPSVAPVLTTRPKTGHSSSFGEVARSTAASSETGSAERVLRGAVQSLVQGQRNVDKVIESSGRGRVYSMDELIAVQAGVYRYTYELELASKLVEKATGSVKQTLQSQQ